MNEILADGVRVLGAGVPYLDGAEDELLSIVTAAADRSTDSDELAASIRDWPTRYHLSRLRANLLLPLRFAQGARVLDVGCGTGVLTRALAERGANVTGLEGSLDRCRVAAARTTGMANCEIVCGSLDEYLAEGHEQEFDLVLVCGVLEYASAEIGGGGGAERMLHNVAKLLRPDGAMALAIENQLGLKYLLSYPEDHWGIPWIGINGYRSGRRVARTYSRRTLSGLLASSGFGEQRWFYPYPDYKLPTLVLSDEAYEPEHEPIPRLFNRVPVRDFSAGPYLVADAVAAYQTFLEAGLARDTANSFLIVAGREQLQRHVNPGLLWITSSERRAEFIQRRRVTHGPDGYRLVALDADLGESRNGPLLLIRDEVAVTVGANLEDEVLQAAAQARSVRDLQPLLSEWWQAAMSVMRSGEGVSFDVLPRNFIRDDAGELHYVDQEFRWTEAVPDSWPLLRALWQLVEERMWPSGSLAGISHDATQAEATLALATLVQPGINAADLAEALAIEAQLQARVSGGSEPDILASLRSSMERPLRALHQAPPLVRLLDIASTAEAEAHRRVVEAQTSLLAYRDEIIGLRARVEALQRSNQELIEKVRWLRSREAPKPYVAARRLGGKVKRRLS